MLASHLPLAVVLFFVSACVCMLVLRLGILDVPNARSSHERPTPSTGGIGIFAAVGLAFVWATEDGLARGAAALAAAAAGMALIGLLDDLGRFATFRVKLVAQLAAAAAAPASGIAFTQFPVPGVGAVDLGWAGFAVTIAWLVAMTNIFNFMDGIDGLAGGTAVIAAVFLGAAAGGPPLVPVLCVALAASVAGFLVFNFPRARLFMGDVGSLFVGFSLAALAVVAAEAAPASTSLLIVPLLFFNFIFDTVFTCCRRALRGENITQAHREHLYQLMAGAGLSHAQVSLFHFGVAVAQGVGALVLIRLRPEDGWLAFVPFLLFQLLYAAVVLKKRRRAGGAPGP